MAGNAEGVHAISPLVVEHQDGTRESVVESIYKTLLTVYSLCIL